MALRQRQANLPFEVATEVEPTTDRKESKTDRSEFPSNLLIYAVILPLAIVFMILVIYLRSASQVSTTPTSQLKNYQYISTSKQKSVKDIYYLGGAITINEQQKLTSQIEKYDVAFDKITSTGLLRSPRYHHASVALQDNFYIIGGSVNPQNNENGMTASVEKYIISSDSRITVANMRRRRYGHAAIVWEHSIFVLGGETDDTADTSMEIYDAPNNQWNDAAEISQKRVFTSAVLIGPCIYVMGGHAGTPYTATNTMEKYDIFRKNWVLMPQMNVKRFGHASVVVQNRYIYVFGGRDENDRTLDSVERFDITTNSWSLIESMPTKRAFFAAAVVEPYIALIGGHNGIKIDYTIYKYDLASKRYRESATMSQPTMGLSVAVY